MGVALQLLTLLPFLVDGFCPQPRSLVQIPPLRSAESGKDLVLRKEWPSIREAAIAIGVKPDRVDDHLRGRLLNLPARLIYAVGKLFKSERAQLIDDLISGFAACRSRSDLEACYFAYREDPRRNPNKLLKKLLQPNRRKVLRTYDMIRGESEAVMGFSVRVD